MRVRVPTRRFKVIYRSEGWCVERSSPRSIAAPLLRCRKSRRSVRKQGKDDQSEPDLLNIPHIPNVWRLRIVVMVLVAVVAFSPKDEHGKGIGSNFQIALPLLAWGCEALNGSGPEYLLRYAVMFGILHGTKQGLGDAELNQRPNGGLQGFPSGHTATAVFGASSLAQTCFRAHPIGQGTVLIAAAFT